ncbi:MULTISPECIES: hypothetical protein [unclassified Acinetobacter]|uniref:hypothetical protein n=1 Tax=unclassified Acinetobacter TaxID=196816 RepID=UPI0035B6CE72
MNNSNHQQIEIIHLDCEHFGGHAEHWKILTQDSDNDVTLWLQYALSSPSSPMGLCHDERQLPKDVWLLQGPENSDVVINQIVLVENHHPKSLKTAFPSFTSPYKVQAKITRILSCTNNHEGVLQAELANGTVLYGYDSLFAVNQACYQAGKSYDIELSAFSYNLEKVPTTETMQIDDPAAIHHHRALNDILVDHQGKTPDNLQELLKQWQPKNADDLQPVTIDISKMVAYLYGEHLGQEDEAWFQGDIVGKSHYNLMGQNVIFYDVAIMREENAQPIIVRMINHVGDKEYEVGDYVRGNIWLQFKIYD